MGHAARNPQDLLVVKLLSLCVGAISLVATVTASYFFLRMRRSFRHEFVTSSLFSATPPRREDRRSKLTHGTRASSQPSPTPLLRRLH
jgi:hypothetical protein